MQDDNQARKRPGWVWAIFIFYSLSAAYMVLSYYLIYSGSLVLQPAQRAYFNHLSYFDIWSSVVVVAIKFAGAVTLFLLRRIAFKIFVTGFVLEILTNIWFLLTLEKVRLAAIGSADLVGVFLGWVITIAICAYAWRLEKAGVLR